MPNERKVSMSTAVTVITIIHVVICLGLIGIVLFQSGKRSGLSGAIAGAADTFLVKNKSKGLDAALAKATKWVGLAFVVVTLVLNILS